MPKPSIHRADADGCARALRDALRRLMLAHAALDDARRPCGTPLPVPHAWALLELRERGPMTITALAARLNIDRTNVSRLCARMESVGEIEGASHPCDGRARLVQLTDAGARLARNVDATSADHFATILDRLGSDSGSIVKALDALARSMTSPATTDSE